jgi:thiamine biosynthesis lipoprotein
MGVEVQVVLYAPSQTAAEEAVRASFDEIAAINDIMSNYVETSELMQLTERAAGSPVQVSPELFFILQRSLALSSISDGAFDITVGPYASLWREARRSEQLPADRQLAAADSLVGWQKIELDPVARTVQLQVPGMEIDLGGIAKGYALDRALAVLKQQGVERALVNAGGDVVVSGSPPGKEGWVVSAGSKDSTRRHITLSHAAVASSGDTEQFVESGGKRYSHIVDPRTGLGLTSRIAVTVVAPDGMTADSYATTVSVLGPEKGRQFVDRFPGVTAYIHRAQPRGPTENP